jgi:hypothetical protein
MQAAADYYNTRPGEDGEYTEREGFTREESGLDHEEVEDEISEAEGHYAYRIVLSPGEDVEGEDLEEWTRDVMADFDGDWVAYAHEDQTEHPHVHVIAFTDEKLDRDDFKDMRETGDESYQHLLEEGHELQAEAKIEPDYAETVPSHEPDDDDAGIRAAFDAWIEEIIEEEARLNDPDWVDPNLRDGLEEPDRGGVRQQDGERLDDHDERLEQEMEGWFKQDWGF